MSDSTVIELGVALLLVAVAFCAGVGNTGVGTGGVFITLALHAFTDLPASVVSGTALSTFAVTGVLGAGAYLRSGELAAGEGRSLALAVAGGAGAGVLVGVGLSAVVPGALISTALAAFTVVIGVVVVYRERRGLGAVRSPATTTRRGLAAFAALGAVVGAVSGLLGIGGLALIVPSLVVLGVATLTAIGVGQVASGLLSAAGAAGYFATGDVSVPYALLTGVPEVLGVLVGWRVAHRLPAGQLRIGLGAVLAVSGLALLV